MKASPVLIASLLLISAVATNAAALFTSTATPAGNRAGFGGTVGNEFTVGIADLLVTDLGHEDAGLNGLSGSHQVGIWNASGTLIASATIPASGAPLIDAWRYTAIAPVILNAGQTYRIGGHTAGDNFTDSVSAGGSGVNFAISADAVLSSGALTSSNRFIPGTFGDVTNDGTSTEARWAPANAIYTVVPEPGTSVMISLAGVAILLRRRRRNS